MKKTLKVQGVISHSQTSTQVQAGPAAEVWMQHSEGLCDAEKNRQLLGLVFPVACHGENSSFFPQYDSES